MQLLGKRLGWTIYTPTGHDWWDEGIWNFGRGTYPDDRLAQQYLLAPHEPDNEFPDWPIHFVTLADARQMDWAFVVATLQDNQHGFAQFARETGAQYVYQVGNTGQGIDWSLDPMVLSSSEMPILGRGIVYHQEMDPIAFARPYGIRVAKSFVNCMPQMGPCWDLLQRATIPVGVYGIDAEVIKPNWMLVGLMEDADWGWHDKGQGDGFGHVIHSWAAVGRPLIGHASHYLGKMPEYFWRDGETCIDLDHHSVEEACELVREITPQRHAEMCRAIRDVFDANTDYEGDAERIADFLGLAVAV